MRDASVERMPTETKSTKIPWVERCAKIAYDVARRPWGIGWEQLTVAHRRSCVLEAVLEIVTDQEQENIAVSRIDALRVAALKRAGLPY